ncbi:GLABRA2 expression modulator-like [Panicum virgatum]|uniref:GRAM domain-containing protein n=1 Tax=Panicum virgatum TaxID=38727 RepID=A0A8T0VLH6_PANVG|nr:GLABRA2 expression modulator-like [Panicum virgatum]KAG2635535.1 hypothetical protein PVAP13_2NG365200 [Panicum virgatum]
MQPAARGWRSPAAAAEASPYAMPSPVQPASPKGTKEAVKNALSRWGRKVGEATRKAEDLSRNTWQHLRTAPSIAEAALGRIAQGTKVLAEGGHDRIFRQAFSAPPDEQLRKSYACYLSTAAGPVVGVLYLSTARVAFCSDGPLSYEAAAGGDGDGDRKEWSYYKVAIPLHRLRAASASASKLNPAEKFIELVSVDRHEFWFMGFVNYDGAVAHLQEALSGFHNLQA